MYASSSLNGFLPSEILVATGFPWVVWAQVLLRSEEGSALLGESMPP